jgi:hypothetical protein
MWGKWNYPGPRPMKGSAISDVASSGFVTTDLASYLFYVLSKHALFCTIYIIDPTFEAKTVLEMMLLC